MKEQQDFCLNCEETLPDERFKYCPHCGQHTKDKLTLVELFRNTIANYFSFDSRIKRSFIPLIFKPGYLAKAFIFGKRQKYIHPAQFYLFCAVVFFFLFALATKNIGTSMDLRSANIVDDSESLNLTFNGTPLDSLNVANMNENDKEDLSKLTGVPIDSLSIERPDSLIFNNLKVGKHKLDSLIDSETPLPIILNEIGAPKKGFGRLAAKQSVRFYMNNGQDFIKNFLDKIPITMLLLLPVFALILKLLYIRRKQPYVNHLVFTFYYFTFLILLGVLVLILQFLNKGMHPAFFTFFTLSTLLYLYVAMRKFYQQGRFKTLIKLNFLFWIYTIIALPVAISLMTLFSFLTYGGG